jgi:hypothetical protein
MASWGGLSIAWEVLTLTSRTWIVGLGEVGHVETIDATGGS